MSAINALIERLTSHMGLADMADVLSDCREAADALAAQAAEIERMREALEALYRACMAADERLELADEINGDILDLARQALVKAG